MIYEAAIFDFDGTLVDTMPIHYEAYRRTFEEHGLVLDEATFFQNIGGTALETIPKFLAGRTARASIAELHARKKSIVGDLLTSAEIPLLETAKLLTFLAEHVKRALASSGSRAGIEIVLARLEWGAVFEAVVTGEDVQHGKPAPDLFLLAAARIGVVPARCMVFEDTDDGVAAAHAAGMQVFDVRRTRGRGRP